MAEKKKFTKVVKNKAMWKDKLGQPICAGDRIVYASMNGDSTAMKAGLVLSYTIKQDDWGKPKTILNILNEDGKKVGLQRFPERMVVVSKVFKGVEPFSRINHWFTGEENAPSREAKSQASKRFTSLPFVKEIIKGCE